MFKFLALFFFTGLSAKPVDLKDPDRICGKWISSTKNIIVQVYKVGNSFHGRTVWFKTDDNSKPMEEWTDKHNPDPALRNRKLLGLDILHGMTYDANADSWENGKIYDAQNGKEWSASAHIDKDGQLKVTGYWHFKFIGKTMVFKRALN